MALLALLLFFSLTGLTLNHPEWSGKQTSQSKHLVLPEELSKRLEQDFTANLGLLQSFVETATNLSQPRAMDVDAEAQIVGFDFPLPAGFVYVEVDVAQRLVLMESGAGGLIALLNDLHKGRHTGEVWKWLIDVVAVATLLFAVSGLLIMLQNAKYRVRGFSWSLAGLLSPVLLYLAFVPAS